MNRKTLSNILFVLAVIALVIGASFHGYRMQPENPERFAVGVTMGIIMISIFAIALAAGIVLRILAKKNSKSEEEK